VASPSPLSSAPDSLNPTQPLAGTLSVAGRPAFKEPASWVCAATDGGDGGSGKGNGGGGNGGSSGGNGGNESGDGEEEFLDLSQAEELAAAKGVELPEDYAAVAGSGGLRASVLNQYLAIATGGWLSGMLARSVPAFRDRLVADRMYFFKILAEVTIDSGKRNVPVSPFPMTLLFSYVSSGMSSSSHHGLSPYHPPAACATVAEVRKRGDEFWGEFEFYLSDLLVGLVLDVVLVTLLAPVAVPGRKRKVVKGGEHQAISTMLAMKRINCIHDIHIR